MHDDCMSIRCCNQICAIYIKLSLNSWDTFADITVDQSSSMCSCSAGILPSMGMPMYTCATGSMLQLANIICNSFV
jgi:hypothetical protein